MGELADGEVLGTYVADTIVEEEDSLDDEVFFDNKSHATSALDLRGHLDYAENLRESMGGGGDLGSAGLAPLITVKDEDMVDSAM